MAIAVFGPGWARRNWRRFTGLGGYSRTSGGVLLAGTGRCSIWSSRTWARSPLRRHQAPGISASRSSRMSCSTRSTRLAGAPSVCGSMSQRFDHCPHPEFGRASLAASRSSPADLTHWCAARSAGGGETRRLRKAAVWIAQRADAGPDRRATSWRSTRVRSAEARLTRRGTGG